MKVEIAPFLRRIIALSSFFALCGILTFTAVNAQAVGAVCEPNLPPGISYQSVVNTLFPEGHLIDPSYVTEAASPNLLGLSPTTTVAVTFLGFVSGNPHNRLGYFLFDETNTITNAGAVVFEDASATAAGFTTVIGPFAANSNLGFFMDVNGNFNPDLTFYSLINLNVDDVRHFAAATIPDSSGAIAFGAEDLLGGGDRDYNDLVFTTRVCGSINYCNIPDSVCDTSCNNDPDCECTLGQSQERSCGSDVGECVAGSQSRTCGTDLLWQTWSECVGAVAPTPEVCDGLDNDCDSSIDEELTDVGATCSTGEAIVGACANTGVIVCDNGSPACNATPGIPSTEICDQIDNDCDGEVDEGNVCVIAECNETSAGRTCTAGVGACQTTGTIVCTEQGGVCNAVAGTPSVEICDDIDNDCDASIDEGGVCQINQCDEAQIGQSCVVGAGACQGSGFLTCVEGTLICGAQEGTSSAEICDSIDNNCDGEVDEGLNCNSDSAVSTTPGTGLVGNLEGQGCALNKSAVPNMNSTLASALILVLSLGMISLVRRKSN